MQYDGIAVEVSENVAHVRLNRPKRFNALDEKFWKEFPEVIRRIDESSQARVIVLSSTGKHFTAGMELGFLAAIDSPGPSPETSEGQMRAAVRHRVRNLQHAFSTLERARIPILAAVHGGCVGGGVDMIAACDMRYATEDAFFCIQEINVGMTPDLGTLQRLPHIVPQGILREWAYTGRKVSAARAREVGLVNEVYPDHDQMLAEVLGIAAEIAERAPGAVWGTKESIRYARDHSVEESLDQIATWQSGMFNPDDVREALTARRKRRVPKFADLPMLSRT